jgi:hypothetical protein
MTNYPEIKVVKKEEREEEDFEISYEELVEPCGESVCFSRANGHGIKHRGVVLSYNITKLKEAGYAYKIVRVEHVLYLVKTKKL